MGIPRPVLTACLLILFVCPARSSERLSSAMDSAFSVRDFTSLKNLLSQYRALDANDPNLLFFRAVSAADADSACSLYLGFLEAAPQSPYADEALLRVGQYFFANGDYTAARSYFSRLFRNYPASPLRDDAQFLYCQCVLAQGKADSARAFLNAFVRKVSDSPFVNQAVLDLEQIGSAAAAQKTVYYAVQVAAFREEASAQEAVQKLRQFFPFVEVKTGIDSDELWHVLIGRFADRERAERYADLYIRPSLKKVQIIVVER